MDESLKFQELKELKEKQNRLLVRQVLEHQRNQELSRRIASRDDRRCLVLAPDSHISKRRGIDELTPSKIEKSFGPMETEESIMYQQLKKQNDANRIKADLQT